MYNESGEFVSQLAAKLVELPGRHKQTVIDVSGYISG